jgi:oligopeptide transport system substrate-binding protein
MIKDKPMPAAKWLFSAALMMVAGGFAQSASVPPGVELAEQQHIVRHIKDEPASLDPIKVVGLTEAEVVRDLFEGLVNEDAAGRSVPGVATRWDTNDNRTFIFHLRRDARWSNGDPVTANDFVYSWRRLVDPKSFSTFSWFAELAGLAHASDIITGKLPSDRLGVSAPDDYTLKVQLDKPVPYFVSLTANFSLFPVHRATVEEFGADWTKVGHLVGNGAFQLQSRVVNEKLVLAANPHYWDHRHTVLTQVTFVPINQTATALNRYLAGEVDITESFPSNRYQQLLKTIPDQVFTPDQLGTYYYAFNTRRAPTDDIRVRKALSYAIDRRVIAERVLGAGEKPAWHFTPDVTVGFKPHNNDLQRHTQDELDAEARILLRAAGFGPEKPLTLSLLYNSSDSNEKIAIAIASMWKKKLGVTVKMVNQEWKVYIDNRYSGNFDVVRSSWVGDYNEPSTFLSLLTSSHSGNIARFSDPQYDRLLDEASRQTNAALLAADYAKAEDIIAEQAPIAPIYQYTNARLIKPWVKGYPITNPEDVAYSQSMYILKH